MLMEIVARSAQVLIALGGAYVIAFWFVLIVWTFRDIEARSRSVVTQVMSTLMVVLFFVPGVLLYMILRPKETLDEAFQRSLEEEYLLQDLEELPLCQACHRYVEDDFVLCPHCHAQLREPCVACSRLVDLRWPLCPYCATVQHGRTTQAEPVEAPAARWTAPSLRRRRAVDEGAIDHRPAAAAANGAARRALPGESTVAAPMVDEPAAVVAAEPRATPFTLVSGMRSIVRPLDRVFGRDVHEAEPDHGPTNGNGASGSSTDGASRRFGSVSNGDGETALRSNLFTPINGNGNGKRAETANGFASANGFHPKEEDRPEFSGDDERAVATAENGSGIPAADDELIEIPRRRW